MSKGEVLIAIMNNKADFTILQEQGWYRVPAATAPRSWPPRWLAFYQTKVFEEEAYAVRYFGKVENIRLVRRDELFPNELPNPKTGKEYYQVRLEKLEILDRPILSKRWRRIVFIPTTWQKFNQAQQLNDLYDESPLEDHLWKELKQLEIGAERQWHIKIKQQWYFLDFALFCNEGFIDVETDGDYWHAQKERIPQDNQRDNALASIGWHVLRFNGRQIREGARETCVPDILDTINTLGGLSEEGLVSRHFYSTPKGIEQQLTLFDAGAEYNLE